MKIALMSDIHQDFYGNKFDHSQDIDADVIVVAGDLQEGDGVHTLAQYVKNGKEVIYVPGNHEYYHQEINATRLKLRNSCFREGITMLDRNIKVIGHVRFVGCTLWTNFKLYGVAHEYASKIMCARSMNDHYLIRSNDSLDGRFMPDDSQKLHLDDLAWLDSVLHEYHPGPTVVVTHHAPSFGSINAIFRTTDNYMNAGYASNLESFIQKHSPEFWLHGHVHIPCDYFVMDTRVLCNPRGYTHESQYFEPRVVEL
jgi:Icc-related predicted phosphoesterase